MDDPTKSTASMPFKSIEITTDGTRQGTKFLIDGQEVPNLDDVSFHFYSDDYGDDNVNLYFSTCDPKRTPGTFRESRHYSLTPPTHTVASASIVHVSPDDSKVVALRHNLRGTPQTNHPGVQR
jgi:hypothetical protein